MEIKMLKKIKKMKVMFMAIALVVVATALTSPAVVSYATDDTELPDHYTKEGYGCNNTYRIYTHTGFSRSNPAYTHVLSDGRTCYASRLIYLHRVECSSCHYILNTNAAGECTEEHSKCGTHIVNEPYIGAD